MRTIGDHHRAGVAGRSPAFAQTDPFAKARVEWNKPQKPFRVIDNIYYVGTAGVSAWLIFTLQGFILIDGGLPESAAQIEANIKTLGFDIKNVGLILNSHAHFDHAGGLARLEAQSPAPACWSAKATSPSSSAAASPSAPAPPIPFRAPRSIAPSRMATPPCWAGWC